MRILAILPVLLAVMLTGCKKDEDDDRLSMSGDLNFDFPSYAVVGQKVESYVSGITTPSGSDLEYFWVSSDIELDGTDTDTLTGQAVSMTLPDEPGLYSITAYARSKSGEYYSRSRTSSVQVITTDAGGVAGWTPSTQSITDERDGQEYQLATNNGRNHLHGGICGFDKKRWKPVAYDGCKSLTLRYDSPDGEEGYPGNLQASVCFQLDMRELRIQYRATCDKPCYVNLTHHPYFNLEGEGDIRGHVLKLYSGHYLHTEDLIPDGTLAEAKGTACDFTTPHALERVIEERGGLDDCFVFGGTGMVKRMAGLSDSRASIVLFVASDYPGLQVYTGRYLDVPGGRDGQHYGAYAGVALEPQFYPDSPHHPEFPSALLLPGEEYAHEITYSFAMND